jgi:hypothetical protein
MERDQIRGRSSERDTLSDRRTRRQAEERASARAGAQAAPQAGLAGAVRTPDRDGSNASERGLEASAFGRATSEAARNGTTGLDLVARLQRGMPLIDVNNRVLGTVDGVRRSTDGTAQSLRVRTARGVLELPLDKVSVSANGRAALALTEIPGSRRDRQSR